MVIEGDDFIRDDRSGVRRTTRERRGKQQEEQPRLAVRGSRLKIQGFGIQRFGIHD
jgi:hypothetical protein